MAQPTDADVDALEAELERFKADAARELDEVAFLTDAADACIADARRETHEFTRDVMHGGPDGGPLCVDKTLWHLDASAAREETLLQKMHARSRRLRADITRLEKKIKEQSERGGKGPSTLDFETLRLEISQLEPAVEAVAREAVHLKTLCSRAEVAALDLKTEIAAAEAEAERLAKQEAARLAEAARRDEDAARAVSERAAAERALEALRASVAVTPPVLAMDYIAVKAEVAALEKQCANIERKIEVAQLAARNGASRAGALPPAQHRRRPTPTGAKALDGLLAVQTLR